MDSIFDESHHLAEELSALVDGLPLANDSLRVEVADVACSLSVEHWHSVRALLQVALLPSALVVHRAQFETITRSVWLTYAASDEAVGKFTMDLSPETEQATKNTPLAHEMMQGILLKAPKPAHDALARFKDNSWKALNSYAHAGIHPLRRHQGGYPTELIRSALCNANGLGVVSYMQAAILGGEQPLQRAILDTAGKHPTCLPPPL